MSRLLYELFTPHTAGKRFPPDSLGYGEHRYCAIVMAVNVTGVFKEVYRSPFIYRRRHEAFAHAKEVVDKLQKGEL